MKRSLYTLAFLVLASGMVASGCGDGEPDVSGDGDGAGGTGDGDGSGGSGDGESCRENQEVCDGFCTSVESDPENCGDCGTECGVGEACFSGECGVSERGTGLVSCDEVCVDLQTSDDHCGGCGDACASGESCENGQCEVSCPVDFLTCDGECIDPSKDRNYCGATSCDDVGAGGAGGASGGNGAVCGAAEVCFEGACVASCPSGQIVCGDTCVNPLNDPMYCGATDCSAQGTSGTPCGAAESCVVGECRSVALVWTPGVAIDDSDEDTGTNGKHMGTDSLGNVMILWRQFEGGILHVFARRYQSSTRTWSDVLRVDDSLVKTRNLSLDVSAGGRAVAAWDEELVPGVSTRVMISVFDPESLTWGDPIQASQAAGISEVPGAGLDAEGNVHVLWHQQLAGGGEVRITRNYFVAATSTFTGEVRVTGYGENTDSFNPIVEVNEAGDAAAVWYEMDAAGGGAIKGLATVFDQGSATWSTPKSMAVQNAAFESLYAQTGNSPDVGLDAAGNAYVVWSQWSATTNSQDVWMNKYSGGWGTASVIESATGSARFPRIFTEPSGTSVVLFDYGPGAGPFAVHASRVGADLSFDDQTLESGLTVRSFANGTLDSEGNAHAVWLSGGHVRSAYSGPDGQWLPAQNLTLSSAPAASDPGVVSGPGGRGFASWYQDSDLFFARYD